MDTSPRMIMEHTMKVKSILPNMMTDTAMAAMNSLEPDVKSWPSRNIMLLALLEFSPKRSPMNP